MIKNINYKGGSKALPLKARLYFQIGLHRKDEAILTYIQSKLGVGKIYRSRCNYSELQVSSFKDMPAIIQHFDEYPLITKKWADYQLFKSAYYLVQDKQHVTHLGLNKLLAIKASINNGLPSELKENYPNIKAADREVVLNKSVPDSNWLTAFTSGEGSFAVRMFSSSSHRTGYQVQLRFQITQHYRDKDLMEKIVKYLNCGYISIRGDIVDFKVTKYSDIVEQVIPFFDKYPIIGVKQENFKDFKYVAALIKHNEHLTVDGLQKIKQIKSRMNASRESAY